MRFVTKKEHLVMAAAAYRAAGTAGDEKLPSGCRRVVTSPGGTLDGLPMRIS
jgi:hypothetical protein